MLFEPEHASGSPILYLNGAGKAEDAGEGGPIEKLVLQGHVTLAVDLRGVGEIGSDGKNIWGGDWDDFFTAYLLGESLVGMRAEDTLIAARFLSEHKLSPKRQAQVVAVGHAGPPALHAVALEPRLFLSLLLRESLPSWSDVVAHPDAGGQLANTVHGALRVYDLPDLKRSLPPGVVTVENPLDLTK